MKCGIIFLIVTATVYTVEAEYQSHFNRHGNYYQNQIDQDAQVPVADGTRKSRSISSFFNYFFQGSPNDDETPQSDFLKRSLDIFTTNPTEPSKKKKKCRRSNGELRTCKNKKSKKRKAIDFLAQAQSQQQLLDALTMQNLNVNLAPLQNYIYPLDTYNTNPNTINIQSINPHPELLSNFYHSNSNQNPLIYSQTAANVISQDSANILQNPQVLSTIMNPSLFAPTTTPSPITNSARAYTFDGNSFVPIPEVVTTTTSTTTTVEPTSLPESLPNLTEDQSQLKEESSLILEKKSGDESKEISGSSVVTPQMTSNTGPSQPLVFVTDLQSYLNPQPQLSQTQSIGFQNSLPLSFFNGNYPQIQYLPPQQPTAPPTVNFVNLHSLQGLHNLKHSPHFQSQPILLSKGTAPQISRVDNSKNFYSPLAVSVPQRNFGFIQNQPQSQHNYHQSLLPLHSHPHPHPHPQAHIQTQSYPSQPIRMNSNYIVVPRSNPSAQFGSPMQIPINFQSQNQQPFNFQSQNQPPFNFPVSSNHQFISAQPLPPPANFRFQNHNSKLNNGPSKPVKESPHRSTSKQSIFDPLMKFVNSLY